MSFQKQKSFVLKIVFIYGKCMCEGFGENSRDGAWHVDIREGMCIFYLNVCMFVIACALRWGVALVGEFIYWPLLTPLWENIFRYWRYNGG